MNFNLVVRSTGIRFFKTCPKLGNITIWVSNYGKYKVLPGFPIPAPQGCIEKGNIFNTPGLH